MLLGLTIGVIIGKALICFIGGLLVTNLYRRFQDNHPDGYLLPHDLLGQVHRCQGQVDEKPICTEVFTLKLKTYLKTWKGPKAENKWGRLFPGGAINHRVTAGHQGFTKDTIVTMQPYTLSEEAWVTKENASRSYKEAWGFAFSQLLGNVTPGSVDFVKERLSPMLSPEIYQDVIDAIEIQSSR